MNSVLDAIRSVIGEPDFYHQMTNSTNYTWDYGLMLEYLVSGMVLCIVISSVFKLIGRFFK